MTAIIINSTDPKFLGHSFTVVSMTENTVTMIYSYKDTRRFTAAFDDIVLVDIVSSLSEITNRLGYNSYLSDVQRNNWLMCLGAYCKHKNIVPFILTDDNHSMYPSDFNLSL